MGKKSFTWNPDPCIFGWLTEPTSECFFDYWSIHHFYFTGFAYIILHHLLNISTVPDALILCTIVTILHGIEEYQGNTSRLSIEGIVADTIGPLVDPKVNPENREIDNDYFQNSIGDVTSGLISCGLIIWYWYHYRELPYWYLYGIIPMLFILSRDARILYDSESV